MYTALIVYVLLLFYQRDISK